MLDLDFMAGEISCFIARTGQNISHSVEIKANIAIRNLQSLLSTKKENFCCLAVDHNGYFQ